MLPVSDARSVGKLNPVPLDGLLACQEYRLSAVGECKWEPLNAFCTAWVIPFVRS